MVLPGVLGSQGLVVLRPGQSAVPIAFTVDRDSLKLAKGDGQGELRLTGNDGFGLQVTQVMRFSVDSYVVDREIRVSNAHSVPQGVELAMAWTAPVEWPKDQDAFAGPRPIHALRLEKGSSWTRREYLASGGTYSGDGRWVGFESAMGGSSQGGVYLIALIPQSGSFKVTERKREETKGNGAKAVSVFEIGVRGAVPVLAPGQTWDGRVKSYLGPMEYDAAEGPGCGPREGDLLRRLPVPRVVGRSSADLAHGVDCRASPRGDALVLLVHPELRCGDHPADHHHEGAVLPPHAQEHAIDEGDADAAAADQCAALEAQERPAAPAAGDDGAVPGQ